MSEDQLVKVMTLYTDPKTGQLYVKWSKVAPQEFVQQMKMAYGTMFTEIPDD